MADRTWRDVEIDLDDLADAVVEWFERDGFEVQDFQEGPSIFIQARKQNLLTMVSGTGKALNVRISPLARGFKVEVGAGDWLDKATGASIAMAVRLISLPLAIGTGLATGYGIYQQLKLPEELLDFIDSYVDRHGVSTGGGVKPRRRVEAEEAPASDKAAVAFCPQCGAETSPGANFCQRCGHDLRQVGGAPGEE